MGAAIVITAPSLQGGGGVAMVAKLTLSFLCAAAVQAIAAGDIGLLSRAASSTHALQLDVERSLARRATAHGLIPGYCAGR